MHFRLAIIFDPKVGNGDEVLNNLIVEAISPFFHENASYPDPSLFDSWRIGGFWTNDTGENSDPSVLTVNEFLTWYSHGNRIERLDVPLEMDEIEIENVRCPFAAFIGWKKDLHFNKFFHLFDGLQDMNGSDPDINTSFRTEIHDAFEFDLSIVILDLHK